MRTFTMAVDADSRNDFVSQYESESVNKELILKWASEAIYIPDETRSSLVEEVIERYDPTLLDWVDNVWRDLFLIKKNFPFLYVIAMIETDMSDTIFPLIEKAKFTFLTYFSYSNRIRQFTVSSLEEGLMIWAENINILNKQQRKILLKYVHKGKHNPVAVEGLKNVWTTTYGIFHARLTLHIVKTV